ncbi:MAG: DUF3460 family protein [Burkholderiales bacterium]|nr:DUF3460 family protein [Burkholderiales bacterium]
MPKPDRTYVSETTQFLRNLLAEKPHIAEEQKKGRSLWWDRKLDPEEQRRFREASVRQKAYVYQTET